MMGVDYGVWRSWKAFQGGYVWTARDTIGIKINYLERRSRKVCSWRCLPMDDGPIGPFVSLLTVCRALQWDESLVGETFQSVLHNYTQNMSDYWYFEVLQWWGKERILPLRFSAVDRPVSCSEWDAEPLLGFGDYGGTGACYAAMYAPEIEQWSGFSLLFVDLVWKPSHGGYWEWPLL